jgi:uncharacterized DUF497 family protein
MNKFEWDDGNYNHVILDYPERNNSVEEVESIFEDPCLFVKLNKIDEHGEKRFYGIGTGNDDNEKFVVFVFRNDKIRVISCRRANKKERKIYYENIVR